MARRNLLRDERLDQTEVSQVSYQHSIRVTREVQAGSLGEGQRIFFVNGD